VRADARDEMMSGPPASRGGRREVEIPSRLGGTEPALRGSKRYCVEDHATRGIGRSLPTAIWPSTLIVLRKFASKIGLSVPIFGSSRSRNSLGWRRCISAKIGAGRPVRVSLATMVLRVGPYVGGWHG
jgi:hypothetical protein